MDAPERSASPFLAPYGSTTPPSGFGPQSTAYPWVDPSLSLQPNAYFMQGSNAEVGLTCLYPGCTVPPFQHLAELDRHMQQHFGLPPIDQGLNAPFHGLHTPNFGSGYVMPAELAAPAPAFSHSVGLPTTTPPAVASPATSSTGQRHYCPHPGCGASVKHVADLSRHMKKHQDGPKEYDCPIRDCPRQGLRGFARKDKLNDHLKAKHKMAPL